MVYRNATRSRIMQEIEDSLRRLRTDYIDIYQVHWPDPLVPVEETAEVMRALYERTTEAELLPYCQSNDIVTFGSSALCRGLLSGCMGPATTFKEGDLRRNDPKFQRPYFAQYLNAVQQLDEFAQRRFHRRVVQLAVRWMLDQGISVALWGGRHPAQVEAALGIAGWSLNTADRMLIQQIIKKAIADPVGCELIPPLQRAEEQ
jgi:aryl-alcohol dehydrogenase-like predicted oxidoreductase